MRLSSFANRLVLSVAGVFGLNGFIVADEPAAATPNLIKSPSFEEPAGGGGLPDGWEGLNAVPAESYRLKVADEGHTGKKSLQIEGDGQYGVVWGEKLPIDRAQRYRARGYVRIEGDERAAADVKLHYYGAGQEYLGQSRVGFVNPRTPGWQLITVTDQIELFPNASHVGIAVSIAGNGKAWFDDIELHAAKEDRGPVNYVANGDMEDVAADRPAGFHIALPEGGKAECTTSERQPHGGKRCLSFKCDGDWASAGSGQFEIDRTATYTLSGFARSSTGEVKLSIAYFDATGRYLGSTDSDTTDSGSWRELSLRADLGAYPQAARIAAVAVLHAYAAGDFDDLRVARSEGK